jgi:hypothetical protein
MLLEDMDPKHLTKIYSNPGIQSRVIEWIAYVRGYKQHEKEFWAESAVRVAKETMEHLPFNQARIEEEITDSPSDIMSVIAYDMIKLGIIPGYKDKI